MLQAINRPDAIISFEYGRSYKMLRRHLSERGISPEQYRAKWRLPVDYPLVSPAYSAWRTEISREIRLDTLRGGARPAPCLGRS